MSRIKYYNTNTDEWEYADASDGGAYDDTEIKNRLIAVENEVNGIATIADEMSEVIG